MGRNEGSTNTEWRRQSAEDREPELRRGVRGEVWKWQKFGYNITTPSSSSFYGCHVQQPALACRRFLVYFGDDNKVVAFPEKNWKGGGGYGKWEWPRRNKPTQRCLFAFERREVVQTIEKQRNYLNSSSSSVGSAFSALHPIRGRLFVLAGRVSLRFQVRRLKKGSYFQTIRRLCAKVSRARSTKNFVLAFFLRFWWRLL